ncbi:hypothetical protein DAPPUDRAFT_241260 [Daphnia pulex]|uniref:Apple domain-containing protein n=1 Tax=Daphnia pulex TaxID=6669 RepID=E9GDU0_DAPPU|nr:hypothetical protein DAPPUDRAFT_241260 [Daphnia pulex]|eukprot:EFX82420.1 hypothetical protein DAPPUDRAFT_241260 [Daphnia pulex]
MNCDFPGHDIERIASPGENCGSLCIASPNCTHFRHAPDGLCILKEAPLATPVTNTGEGSCGKDHWNSDGSLKWLLNCDFEGHDIGRIESPGDKCGGICVNNPECSHFRFDGQFCRTKKAPQSISRKAINGGACGFIPSRNFVIDKSPGNSGSNVGGFGVIVLF